MPSAAQQYYHWSTADELKFIANLAADRSAPGKLSPLANYAQALRRRVLWSGLDRAAIAAAMREHGFPI